MSEPQIFNPNPEAVIRILNEQLAEANLLVAKWKAAAVETRAELDRVQGSEKVPDITTIDQVS